MDRIAKIVHWIYIWLIYRNFILGKHTVFTENDKCYHHYALGKLQTHKLRLYELYAKEQIKRTANRTRSLDSHSMFFPMDLTE